MNGDAASAPEALLIAARTVHFVAIFVVFGCGAFRLYGLGADPLATESGALAAFDAGFKHVVPAGATIALLSGLALLVAVTARMAGSAEAAFDPATLGVVLVDTSFGHAWCWHLLFAVLLIAAGFMPREDWRRGAALSFALLLLVSLGWVGHAVMDQGAKRITHEVNQMAHLVAAGVWLGGLVPLLWFLRRARREQGPAWLALARATLARFSQVGYVAVALIALTGAVNTAILVGSFHGMIGTPYGRLLSVKILLFVAMAMLALINRYRLLPRLQRGPPAPPLSALARSVLGEQALGFTVLVVVSVLGTWPPALHGGAM